MGTMDAKPDESRRILFVDAFDSFSNNIVGILKECLEAEVILVHMNDELVHRDLLDILTLFDAVVVGPGPGHPANPSDVGFINKLWALHGTDMIPVLGICLGFQSLCLLYGAHIKRLQQARHGIISRPCHSNADIFAGLINLETTQYHSLHVDLLGDEETRNVFWDCSKACPELLPLAWDTSDGINGPILMGARHVSKPLWGVQFHPESICTSTDGKRLISNWWSHAQAWSSDQRRVRMKMPSWSQASLPPGPSRIVPGFAEQGGSARDPSCAHFVHQVRSTIGEKDASLQWEKYSTVPVSPTTIIEELGYRNNDVVLLDSQGHSSGRFSIIGFVLPRKTIKIAYRVSDRMLRYELIGKQGATQEAAIQLDSIDQVWPMLQDALVACDPRKQRLHCRSLPEDSPFWGGLMGYISYEAGLETIDVEPHRSRASSDLPDINFVFIHRSIVVDHKEGELYVQSLLPNDHDWIMKTRSIIETLATQGEIRKRPNLTPAMAKSSETGNLVKVLATAKVTRPTETSYRNKVLKCQDYLAAGDSYELCLTDETTIHLDSALDEWALYKRLRKNNPAPFGAFLRFSDTVIVGSSPERFLSWTRDGKCQFRPIKGTVKKSADMTREKAHAILESSKERAENLMIVDLIRHDLSGVVGARNTWVSKLMVVEEYEKVYQLVSVVEGQLPSPALEQGGPRGIDVLKASLPPGSMTGAPKKRSCQILANIEQRPRGVYSGVLGYMDVGGAGDFSVVIRTAVRAGAVADSQSLHMGDSHDNISRPTNDDKQSFSGSNVWRVGAGGAVTIQSSDEGEFMEMEVKAASVLGALFSQK
ncbi:para-aminobenzoate synthase [Lophiostoma macrostomum CBS 122681]|uniref:aminodeoxychorismate synthase n=1 Tax=Lophiostoma macrostomum CBS 122681 TaxID=1314788 RepID=A0A6A6T8Y1_9PLEO|nr:para-aminobenzoate synthase [Lophiostoma macrostomum CBS 122681]